MNVTYEPIGTVNSPFESPQAMPVQPPRSQPAMGSIDIHPEYAEGLTDLDGFSHIIVLYHFHRARPPKMTVVPFLDTQPRGLFATRAPVRPNPIGISILTLEGITGTRLTVSGIDILDQTPVLDIKPYVPAFDSHPHARFGWLENVPGVTVDNRGDDRFSST